VLFLRHPRKILSGSRFINYPKYTPQFATCDAHRSQARISTTLTTTCDWSRRMTTTTPTAEVIGGPERAPAELLNVEAVARLCSCATRTVYRLADAGRLPRPLKLGGMVRWRRGEIVDWIAAGCPAVRAIRGGA
jgi:predicted DNA-binding transcriptional regulator AlpA